MAIKLALFIHVFSIATWFGCITMMTMYLRHATRSGQAAIMGQTLQQTQRWNLTMIIPTAILTLVTGIYMLIQFSANKPTWLLIKERFGSLVIIAFILLVSFYGRRLVKAALQSGIDAEACKKIVSRYNMMLNITVLCMVVLIFVVTMKL